MKTDFPLDFYNQMIDELKQIKKGLAFTTSDEHTAIQRTITILMKEIEWYSQRKWYSEEDIREEFGKLHPITDRSIIAWEELENMLIGEQISYMAESLDLEYNKKVGMWT